MTGARYAAVSAVSVGPPVAGCDARLDGCSEEVLLAATNGQTLSAQDLVQLAEALDALHGMRLHLAAFYSTTEVPALFLNMAKPIMGASLDAASRGDLRSAFECVKPVLGDLD